MYQCKEFSWKLEETRPAEEEDEHLLQTAWTPEPLAPKGKEMDT